MYCLEQVIYEEKSNSHIQVLILMQSGDPVIQRDYQNYKVSWYSLLDDFAKNNITRLNIGEMILVHSAF